MIIRPRNVFIRSVWILTFLLLPHAAACARTAVERIERVLYVDQTHPLASDRNPGSQALPFKTIGRAAAVAVEINSEHAGIKIQIAGGVYREGITLEHNGRETDAPMAFEAAGEVVVTGSDVWTGWESQKGTPVLTHAWPHRWGLAAVPSGWEPHRTVKDIVRRREMVFVNGHPLDQVRSHAELQPGRFFVDEKGQTIYMRLPEGLTIDRAVVEVAVRAQLFWASGKSNIVLRGICFQHSNTTLDEPAVLFYDSSNILVEGCIFRWNNWGGLGFGRSHNLTLRRNEASYNGGAGIGTYKTRTAVFEDNETSYNNQRGIKGGFSGWAVAGMKHLLMHGGVFLRHKALHNQTHGIWFDTDCEHIFIAEGVFSSNMRHGVYIEANQGPITIRNSRICRNQDDGVFIANSAQVSLDGNILYGNAGSQIMVSGLSDSARPWTNWETGEKLDLLTEQGSWRHNVVVATEAKQVLVATSISPPLWRHFLGSLKSDRNVWYHPHATNVLQIAGGYGGDCGNLKTWQSITHQDGNSVFADPRFNDPTNNDFRMLPDSPFWKMDRSARGSTG